MAAGLFPVKTQVWSLSVTREEVAKALRKLKARKAVGPDGVQEVHMKCAGDVVQEWLYT